MDLGFEHEAFGIHQQMALPTIDLLSTIVTTFFSPYPASFDRLGVHYPGPGLRIPPQVHPKSFTYGLIELLPGTI